mmetsp:Transcript_1239/g.1759  ORF Transcript_1239/g.1759 Transcript_1239/m.1759 type:complete len:407 (-) Transcript_1239:1408-2628(-)
MTLKYGDYCLVTIPTTNLYRPRVVGGKALRPSNDQGHYFFMNLISSRCIHAAKFQKLPMPEDIIDRVHQMAKNEGQPKMINGPIFEYDNSDLDDGDDYIDEIDNELINRENRYIKVSNEGQNLTTHEPSEYEDITDIHVSDNLDIPPPVTESIDEEEEKYTVEGGDEDSVEESENMNNQFPSRENNSTPVQQENDEEISNHEQDNIQDLHSDDDTQEESEKTHNYNLRSVGKKDYSDMFIQLAGLTDVHDEETTEVKGDMFSKVVHVTFTQMSAKKGIKEFGERAIAAVLKEYRQLHDKQVFERIRKNVLTNDIKKSAHQAVYLIKHKRNGDMKGRACVDGRRQRSYINPEETSSPTVLLEAQLGTLLVDAHEKRDVAVFDIPGAYLNAFLPESRFEVICFDGQFA